MKPGRKPWGTFVAQGPSIDRAQQRRRALLARVHIDAKELGLSGDVYRDVLFSQTGKDSAGDMSEDELVKVLDHLKARGGRPAQPAGRSGPARKPADHKVAIKARALWISLHHLGAVANPSEAALEAFARRQLGCERLQWARQGEAFRLIEALKAMAEREGWNQDTAGLRPEAVPLVLRRRLVERILGKLREAGIVPEDWRIETAAWRLAGIEMPALIMATTGELDLLARALGDALRAAGAEGGDR